MATGADALPGPFEGDQQNHSFALQNYVLLQQEHESLRQRLDQLQPASVPEAMCTRVTASLAGSPTRPAYASASLQSSPSSSRSPSVSRSHRHRRRASLPAHPRPNYAFRCLETVMDEATLREVAEEEAKLF